MRSISRDLPKGAFESTSDHRCSLTPALRRVQPSLPHPSLVTAQARKQVTCNPATPRSTVPLSGSAFVIRQVEIVVRCLYDYDNRAVLVGTGKFDLFTAACVEVAGIGSGHRRPTLGTLDLRPVLRR